MHPDQESCVSKQTRDKKARPGCLPRSAQATDISQVHRAFPRDLDNDQTWLSASLRPGARNFQKTDAQHKTWVRPISKLRCVVFGSLTQRILSCWSLSRGANLRMRRWKLCFPRRFESTNLKSTNLGVEIDRAGSKLPGSGPIFPD